MEAKKYSVSSIHISKTIMIEFAKIMKPKELKEFYDSIKKLNESKKTRADSYFYEKKDFFIKEYYDYETLQIETYHNQKRELLRLKDCWDKKICFGCGSRLRLINSDYGSFWGCSNYRDKLLNHKTFQLHYEDEYKTKYSNLRVKINAHWATDIIRKTKSQKTLKASQLINLYEEIGLEDLRKKYGYKNTMQSISGYVTARKKSFKEEVEITSTLSKFFPKSNIQLGIKYKMEGANERVAIIDFILSDKNIVYIIEIKRSVSDIKSKQLKLYFDLMIHIMNQVGDARECKALFIAYNKRDVPFRIDGKYVLFRNVKNVNSKENLMSIFNRNAEIEGS